MYLYLFVYRNFLCIYKCIHIYIDAFILYMDSYIYVYN